MGGLYFPAHVNQKRTQLDSMLAFWSYFTFQTENFSIGVGPEFGTGSYAVTAGIEGRLTSADKDNLLFPIALGGYVRRSDPWVNVPRDFNGKWGAWEGGARLSAAVFFLQYSIYQQDEGVQNFVIAETSTYTEGFHSIMLGVDVGAMLRTEGWL